MNEHNPLTCEPFCHYCNYYRAEIFAHDIRYFEPYFYSWTMFNYRKYLELHPEDTCAKKTFEIYFDKYRRSIDDK